MKLLEIKDYIAFHNPCKMFNEATQSCKRQLVYGWYTVVFIVIFLLSAQSEFVPSGQRLLLIEVLEDVVDGEDWLRTALLRLKLHAHFIRFLTKLRRLTSHTYAIIWSVLI